MLIIIEDNIDNVTTAIPRIQCYSQFVFRIRLNKDRTELKVVLREDISPTLFKELKADLLSLGSIEITDNFYFKLRNNKE